MANQKIWDAANNYWTHIFYKWPWFTLLIPIPLLLSFPKHLFFGPVLGHALAVILTVPATELYLDKHFDKNGNPK